MVIFHSYVSLPEGSFWILRNVVIAIDSCPFPVSLSADPLFQCLSKLMHPTDILKNRIRCRILSLDYWT